MPKDDDLDQFLAGIGCNNEFAEFLIRNGLISRDDLVVWWRRYQHELNQYSPADPPEIEVAEVADDPHSYCAKCGEEWIGLDPGTPECPRCTLDTVIHDGGEG